MSKKQNLLTFVREKAEEKGKTQPEIDWSARKKDWLKSISDLYATVRRWLSTLEKDGHLKFLTTHVNISEENIGSYDVEVLTILIGKQKVVFHPKGTLIVGAEGRVDIRGQNAVRSVVLDNGKWRVVEKTPRLRLFPFNEDSFQDVLSEVMV